MRRLILALVLALVCVVGMPLSASAAFNYLPAPSSSECSQASRSTVCTGQSPNVDPIAGNNGLMIKIVHFIALISGIAAVIVLIVGGIKYTTANGDSNNITSAKNTIIYALVGLVVIVAGQTLITYVLSKI